MSNELPYICGKYRLFRLKGLAFLDKKESMSLYTVSLEHHNYSHAYNIYLKLKIKLQEVVIWKLAVSEQILSS